MQRLNPQDPIQTKLIGVNPSVIKHQSNRKITLSLEIRNNTAQVWRNIKIYPTRSYQPIQNAATLLQQSKLSATTKLSYELLKYRVKITKLAPGETSYQDVSFPRRLLSKQPGVYWVGANIYGSNKAGRDNKIDSRIRTTLPVFAKPLHKESLKIGLVLTFLQPVIHDFSGAIMNRSEILASVKSGKLAQQLSRAKQLQNSQVNFNLLFDPGLIEAVKELQQQSQAAETWITDFLAITDRVPAENLRATVWGNPDLTALASTSRPDLTKFFTSFSYQLPNGAKPTTPWLNFAADQNPKLIKANEFASIKPSKWQYPDPTDTGNAAQLQQQLLSLTSLGAKPAPLVITPDIFGSFNFSDLFSAGKQTLVGQNFQESWLTQRSRPLTGESLGAPIFRLAKKLLTIRDNFSSLYAKPTDQKKSQETFNTAIYELLSSENRSIKPENLSRGEKFLNAANQELNQVKVISAPYVTLASNKGIILVTVVNELTKPIKVKLGISSHSNHLKITDTPVLTLQKKQSSTVRLAVSAKGSVAERIEITARTLTNHPIGKAAPITVRNSTVGLMLWLIAIAGMAPIVVYLVKKARARKLHSREWQSEHADND